MNALLVVDIQNDFVPGGALPVPDGNAVVPVANRLMAQFELVLATQDWHPPNHGSFASQHPGRKPGDVVELNGLPQVLWPDHCVQGTPGADFVPQLDVSSVHKVFRKGTDPTIDSYSGFFDNGHRRATGLGDYLRECGIKRIHIVGLTTDYCVKFTALDARRLGLETCVVREGVRGIDVRPGDCERALEELAAAGVTIL